VKKLVLVSVAILAMVGLSYAQKTATYKGQIMDSFCADKGDHGGKPAAECTTTCVKMGATYVLYDAANKMSYELDDQKKPAQFAGKNVEVTGTLDQATKKIHVTGIKAA